MNQDFYCMSLSFIAFFKQARLGWWTHCYCDPSLLSLSLSLTLSKALLPGSSSNSYGKEWVIHQGCLNILVTT